MNNDYFFENCNVFDVVMFFANSIFSELLEFLSNTLPIQQNNVKNSRIQIENEIKNWFRTSEYGGIYLNVKRMYEDNVRCFDVDMKVEYLKNLTISTNSRFKITGKIILISNFGVVDGHDFFLKEYKNDAKKPILLYEFKDALPYFYDSADVDGRLKNIMKLNLQKFSPILTG